MCLPADDAAPALPPRKLHDWQRASPGSVPSAPNRLLREVVGLLLPYQSQSWYEAAATSLIAGTTEHASADHFAQPGGAFSCVPRTAAPASRRGPAAARRRHAGCPRTHEAFRGPAGPGLDSVDTPVRPGGPSPRRAPGRTSIGRDGRLRPTRIRPEDYPVLSLTAQRLGPVCGVTARAGRYFGGTNELGPRLLARAAEI